MWLVEIFIAVGLFPPTVAFIRIFRLIQWNYEYFIEGSLYEGKENVQVLDKRTPH